MLFFLCNFCIFSLSISSKLNKLLKIGQYVEIINYSHGIDELAKQSETISNEILTSISSRVQRIYK